MAILNSFSSVEDALIYIGNRIREQRIKSGYSQEELALKAGVSNSSLYRLEKGQSVQMDSFIRVLKSLNLLELITVVLPENQLTPIEIVDRKKNPVAFRRRVSARRSSGFKSQIGSVKRRPTNKNWKWGE